MGVIANGNSGIFETHAFDGIERLAGTKEIDGTYEDDKALGQLFVAFSLTELGGIDSRLIVAQPAPDMALVRQLHLNVVHAPVFAGEHVHADSAARRCRFFGLFGVEIADLADGNAEHVAAHLLLAHNAIEHPTIRELEVSQVHSGSFG